MANKIETSSKNIKPQHIYVHHIKNIYINKQESLYESYSFQ